MDSKLADKINIKNKTQQGCTINLTLEADADFVNNAFQNATVNVQAQAAMPGFRAGKMPINMVKKHFGQHIKERAFDLAVRLGVNSAIVKENIAPVSSPVLKDIKFEEGQPMTLEVEVEVAPELEPKNYTGAKVTKKSSAVSDENYNHEINALLEHNARLESVEGAVEADSFVIVDYKAEKEGKEVPEMSAKGDMIDMSAPQTVLGLTDALKGMKKGETKNFTAGEGDNAVNFEVTVNEVKKKILPALDDAFAKNMGFGTAEELKNHIRTAMEQDAKNKSEQDCVRQIEDHLVTNNDFELPKSLVEHHVGLSLERLLERMMPGGKNKLTDEQSSELRNKLRPSVEKDMKIGYILNAIASKENLQATTEDVEAELEKNILQAPNEETKQKVREFFEKQRSEIMATLTERKVVEFLKTKASITEEK